MQMTPKCRARVFTYLVAQTIVALVALFCLCMALVFANCYVNSAQCCHEQNGSGKTALRDVSETIATHVAQPFDLPRGSNVSITCESKCVVDGVGYTITAEQIREAAYDVRRNHVSLNTERVLDMQTVTCGTLRLFLKVPEALEIVACGNGDLPCYKVERSSLPFWVLDETISRWVFGFVCCVLMMGFLIPTFSTVDGDARKQAVYAPTTSEPLTNNLVGAVTDADDSPSEADE